MTEFKHHNEWEKRAFIALLILVSLAFAWLLRPYFAAIFWAYALTIILYPLQQRYLKRVNSSANTKALVTLFAGLVLMIIPVIFVVATFTAQVSDIIQLVESGEIKPDEYIEEAKKNIPKLDAWLDKIGVSIEDLQERIVETAKGAGESLPRYGLSIGQNALSFAVNFFLMLYLAFFFLRDGKKISETLIDTFPIKDKTERALVSKITEVTQATIKGNFAVACVQGASGGLIFALLGISGPLLWGVAMVFASLLPAVGAAIIWVPVAIYLFSTGATIQAIILVVFGVGVIGLVDNFLRPMLVSKDTGLPDYLVLLSTLGGLSLLGLNGFVVGPIIAALFVVSWQIFRVDFKSEYSSEDADKENIEQ